MQAHNVTIKWLIKKIRNDGVQPFANHFLKQNRAIVNKHALISLENKLANYDYLQFNTLAIQFIN